MSYARSLQDIRRPPMSKVAEARAKLEAGTLDLPHRYDAAMEKLMDEVPELRIVEDATGQFPLRIDIQRMALPPAEFRPVEHTPWDEDRDYDSNGQA